jgi:Lon protease-like protein
MMTDDLAALDRFGGEARLFPLPNLVFFPQVVQGLHVFEPRYRQMTDDALAGDGLIALVLLREGWEDGYDAPPDLAPVGCLGRIVQHERLPDGRYNLRLKGLARVRLDEETESDKQYRTARVTVLADEPCDLGRLAALRKQLAAAVLPRFEPAGPAHRHLSELFDGEMPLGQLCDVLAYALPLPVELKQQLLTDLAVDDRADRLAAALRLPNGPAGRRFPPEFSAN